MAHQTLTACTFYVDQYDLSGDINQHRHTFTQDAVRSTTFVNSGANTYTPGLRSATHTQTGFSEADGVDAPYDALSANDNLIVTVTPGADTIGNPAILYQSVKNSVSFVEGSIGNMAGLTVSGQITGPTMGGFMLANKASRNSSSNGTEVQAGAISASQIGYGALHIFSGTASTLAVKIQSDTTGFGSPTDRITFATATTSTNLAQWGSVSGAVTDTFWRALWTVGGGTWSFAVSFGII